MVMYKIDRRGGGPKNRSLGRTPSSSPGRIKTCLFTEFFIFREVPPSLKNEAKNNNLQQQQMV